jgi:hypothetical protein
VNDDRGGLRKRALKNLRHGALIGEDVV